MAIAKKVNLTEFVKELEKMPKEVVKEAIDATYSGVLGSQEALNKETPVDTGFLLSSWDTSKNPLEPEPSVVIGNTAPYSSVIMEYGARPHETPIPPLLEWAGRKLQKPTTDPNTPNLSLIHI